jgi:hypothetical protein
VSAIAFSLSTALKLCQKSADGLSFVEAGKGHRKNWGMSSVVPRILLVAVSLPFVITSATVGPICLYLGVIGLSGHLTDTSRRENTITGLAMLAIATVAFLVSALWFKYGLPMLRKWPMTRDHKHNPDSNVNAHRIVV